jgi:hypothetical protein
MKRILAFASIAAFMLLLAASEPANAQTSRTWVSSAGDDANPCSRQVPCKTLTGGHSDRQHREAVRDSKA